MTACITRLTRCIAVPLISAVAAPQEEVTADTQRLALPLFRLACLAAP